jgi:hypothetical protein
MTTDLPLSIRDVAPGPGAIRLTGQQANGLPSGVHTGGAWLYQGYIWKPLDARPYANCDAHYPTQEAECLKAMAGEILFPENWWIENRNGRKFIVRKKAYLIPDDIDYSKLDYQQLLTIEKGIRNLNAHHWEIGDEIALAVDPDTYELFLYDLSTAHQMHDNGCYAADEEWRILQFFKLCQAERLVKFRENARHLTSMLIFDEDYQPGYRHVYASFNRPINSIWASIPGAIYRHNDQADRGEAIPWTWVIIDQPLDDETIYRYELTWGWSPIHACAETAQEAQS